MSVQSSSVRLTRILRKNRILRGKTHPFDIDIRWWINFQEIQIHPRGHCDHNRLHWEGHCDRQSDRFQTDTTVSSQSSYTKVFASGGSFQDECDELIGVGQNRSLQRPLSLAVCGERFATPQTLTFAVILPRTVTLRRSSLPDCWQWTHRSFKCHFL